MKSFQFSLFLIVAMLLGGKAMAQSHAVTGRVVDSNQQPIAYATVVALSNGTQAAGCATNDLGTFSLALPNGRYTFNISFLGYESVVLDEAISGTTSLGDIVLERDDTAIDEVVVTAQLIRREADRFVVDVANSPAAIGKDGEELLKSAPGVWIQDDAISINGNSGSKVYLNDREVRLDDEQLISYLRSLTAEDIQRIEVVPQTGADYDASSSGGIIKITTRRRLDMGLMGTASLQAGVTKGMYNVGPSISLNYTQGRINAYGRAWGGLNSNCYTTTEHTDYTSGTIIDAASEINDNSHYAGANAGVVYDITDRHSVGGEIQFNYYGGDGTTDTWTEHQALGTTTRSEGDYTNDYHSRSVTGTINYIYKLDDVGSTLKFIGDYTNRRSPNYNGYFDTSFDMLTPLERRDSTHRNSSLSNYQLGTATVALEKVISPRVRISAGLKYTYNKNSNGATYEYLRDDAWQLNTDNSYNIGYTENIGAAYITASANLGRVSLVGGLRGEYTNFRNRAGSVEQNYFDLFPNANISYALTADGAYSLIAQYSRTISRPSFWALSPEETKISEYMIQRGNPNLKASYDNSLSVTAVLKYKYTITLGMKITQNAIQQTTLTDSNNPELLILQSINYPTMNNFFASVNLPVQITQWWSANINFTGMYMGQRIYIDEPLRRNFMCFANVQTTFTLPHNFFIELGGMYMHGMTAGNTTMADMGNMNIHIKKRMLDNKLTLSVGVHNIIPMTQGITIEEATFRRVMMVDQPWQRPTARFSISYNFNAGKQFRARSVESGSADDLSRLGGGE